MKVRNAMQTLLSWACTLPEERGPKGNIIYSRKNTMEMKKTSIGTLAKKEWVPACRTALAEDRKTPELKIHINIF